MPNRFPSPTVALRRLALPIAATLLLTGASAVAFAAVDLSSPTGAHGPAGGVFGPA